MHKINNEKVQLTLVKSVSIGMFKAPKKRKYMWLSSDLSDVIKIFYSGLTCFCLSAEFILPKCLLMVPNISPTP